MSLRAVLFLLCLGAAAAGLTVAETQKVAAEKLPPAVWKAIQAQSGGRQPDSIERDDSDGQATYEAIFAEGTDQQRSITVAENGTLIGMDVALPETPAAVQKTIAAQLNGGSLDGIEKNLEDGELSYDVDFTTKAGQERSFSVAEDGTLLSIEVALEETPPAVQGTIKTHFADGKISRIERTFDEGVTAYDVDFTTKDGKARSLTVADDGRLTSVEVTLDEMTPAAQKAISKRIGGGHIIRLSQSIGDKQTVKDYVVEGIVDGRSVTFRVGLKGKFLGNLD